MTLLMRRPHSTLALAAALALASCSSTARESADQETVQAPARDLAIDERCIITPVPKHASLHATLSYDRDTTQPDPDDHLIADVTLRNWLQGASVKLWDPSTHAVAAEVDGIQTIRIRFDLDRTPGHERARVSVWTRIFFGWTQLDSFYVPASATPPAGFDVGRLPRMFSEKHPGRNYLHVQFRDEAGAVTPFYATLMFTL
jgi:hypothetical protein